MQALARGEGLFDSCFASAACGPRSRGKTAIEGCDDVVTRRIVEDDLDAIEFTLQAEIALRY